MKNGISILLLLLVSTTLCQGFNFTEPLNKSLFTKYVTVADDSGFNSVTYAISANSEKELSNYLASRSFSLHVTGEYESIEKENSISTCSNGYKLDESLLMDNTIRIEPVKTDLAKGIDSYRLENRLISTSMLADPTWEEFVGSSDTKAIDVHHHSDPSGRIVISHWYKTWALGSWKFDKYVYIWNDDESALQYCGDQYYKLKIRILAEDHATPSYSYTWSLNCE